MRLLYRLLVYLLAPLVIAIEGWKALWHPEQRGRVGERLGFVARPAHTGGLWVHAVSVGEVQAAAALIAALRRRHPDLSIVLSTVTAAGAQRAHALFKDDVHHCYLPYDLPGSVRRFLDRIAPQAAIILETEIWPTLYAELGRRHIPLLLASARLSPKSVARYRRMASLFRDALAHDISVGAQTHADAERFGAIGANPERVRVTGNVKYDLVIPDTTIAAGHAVRRQWGEARPVWVAGSTHAGEEEAALAAHARVLAQHPSALLLLVPRHPQRFDAVRALLRKGGTAFAARSAGELPGAHQSVYLIDTLGELQMFYAAADVAFVAGSLVPIGGHSLLEPAALALPMLSGPHTQNARDIAEIFENAGAMRIVHDAEELAAAVQEVFSHPEQARTAGEAGRAAMTANRGAVDRVVAMVEPLLRT